MNTTPVKMTTAPTPMLPAPLRLPVSLIPSSVHATLMVATLSRLFAKAVDTGDLDFLEERSVKVDATDAGASFAFGMDNGKLVKRAIDTNHDLTLRGKVYDFLLLGSRREDADTLFFQRRLKMEGDTNLGLEIKNFLDGMDPDDMPFQKPITAGLDRISRVFERFF